MIIGLKKDSIVDMNEKVIKIAWWGLYSGEEPPLVGEKGTGAIFFSGCNLHCVFCQNYQISQEGLGKNYSLEDLVKIMLSLQEKGAVSLDLVSPTVWWPKIKEALIRAKKQALKIPIIWNSNAYESVEALKEFKGLVDIYLPDFKYGDDAIAWKYSRAKNYSQVASRALQEMWSQVGQGGLIVRHLILPNNLKNSFRALELMAKISPEITLSLMRQYVPVYRAKEYPEINRRVTEEEWQKVFAYSQKLGFHQGWVQDEEDSSFLPDFQKDNPFVEVNSQNNSFRN